MSHTLAEVAEQTGKTQTILRKHIERGKLRATKDGPRLLIEDEDLEDYLASDIFEEASVAVQQNKNSWEIGNIIAKLPVRLRNAISDGMPTAKKAGSPDAWIAATNDIPKQRVPVQDGDPHWGFTVGYQHLEEPRWTRNNSSTWSIGGASYSWDPAGIWVGGGTKEGIFLPDDISPANPDTHFRPLAPGGVASVRPTKK